MAQITEFKRLITQPTYVVGNPITVPKSATADQVYSLQIHKTHFKFQGIMVHYHLPCTEFHISMDLIKLRFNQHNIDPNTENNADKSNVPSAKSMNRIIKL